MKFLTFILYALPGSAVVAIVITFLLERTPPPAGTLIETGRVLEEGGDIRGEASIKFVDGTLAILGSGSVARLYRGQHGTTSAVFLARGWAVFRVGRGGISKVVTSLGDVVAQEAEFGVALRSRLRPELYGKLLPDGTPYRFRAPVPFEGLEDEVVVDMLVVRFEGKVSLHTLYRNSEVQKFAFVDYSRLIETNGPGTDIPRLREQKEETEKILGSILEEAKNERMVLRYKLSSVTERLNQLLWREESLRRLRIDREKLKALRGKP